MNFVLLATAWGPKFGGINAFNRDLAVGLASVLGKHGKVFCACIEPTGDDVRDAQQAAVSLIPIRGSETLGVFREHWTGDVHSWLTANSAQPVFCWVGHDVVSGRAARMASQKFGGSLALIHHMSYSDYQGFKDKLGREVYRLSRTQEELFEPDDSYLFSVGPLLRQSAKDLSGRDSTELIPGFPELPRLRPRRDRLDAITFGRMDRASDAIKQGRLAVAAWGLAHKRAGMGVRSEMMRFPLLSVIGIEEEVVRGQEEELKNLADSYAGREVNVRGLPFDSDRSSLFRIVGGANVAMMLSLHDGFGLTGWEAIAAEVPLIVGQNTGLFKLIDERLLGNGTGCLHTIDIKGSRTPDGENFQDTDLERVCDTLLEIAGSLENQKRNAASLRAQLIDKLGCTWQHTARQFLSQIGVELPQNTTSFPSEFTQIEPTQQNSGSETNQRSERLGWSFGTVSGQLIKARPTSNDFDHRDLIRNARRVRIIMNDGRHFFRKYESAFVERRETTLGISPTIETEICILAPEGPHVEVVARRSEKTAAEQSSDIRGSVVLIKEMFRNSDELNLYGMKDFFPYCLFQYDDILLVSLYPAFERIEELPMLLLSPSGETSDLYYSILDNTNLLFHRAAVGQVKWFVHL